MATYPSAIKSFTTKTDNVDYPAAAHINDPQAEITAIETELGTLPKGGSADVTTRLNTMDTRDTNIESGANIAVGAITQCSMATGSTDIQTNSTSYVDMTSMSVVMTTALNSNVLVMFDAIFYPIDETAHVMVELRIDDVSKTWARMAASKDLDGLYNMRSIPLRYLATDLTAASHTFKIRWKVDASIALQYGAANNTRGGGPRTLTVIEMKR